MHQGKLLGAVDSLSNNPGKLFVALRWEKASRKHDHGRRTHESSLLNTIVESKAHTHLKVVMSASGVPPSVAIPIIVCVI